MKNRLIRQESELVELSREMREVEVHQQFG
jgi:hypothetical protein